MKIEINIERKHFYGVIVLLTVGFFIMYTVSIPVKKSTGSHPLQQIAIGIGPNPLDSVDSDANGLIDNSDTSNACNGDSVCEAKNIYVSDNVGIGTNNPNAKLDVRGKIYADNPPAVGNGSVVARGAVTAVYGDTNHYGYFEGRRSDNKRGFYLGWGNGGDLVNLYLDNASKLGITGGNVGIGTTNPKTILHVCKGGLVGGSSYNPNFDVLSVESNGYAGINIITSSDKSGALMFSDDQRGRGGIMYDHSGDWLGFFTNGGPTNSMVIDKDGKVTVYNDFRVEGTLSKGSGGFDIPHPDPSKEKEGWRLRHAFVEAPTRGDNLYRWTVKVKNGKAIIELPDYFKYLNENVQVWISPKGHLGRAYGKINKEFSKIIIIADTDGVYNVLVIGTRKDKCAKKFDESGGVEYLVIE